MGLQCGRPGLDPWIRKIPWRRTWQPTPVLLKSGPGNWGHSACGPTHVARLEFPRETGLILRCAAKATLWVKAQHEGALPPPCIVRKDPRVPHDLCR